MSGTLSTAHVRMASKNPASFFSGTPALKERTLNTLVEAFKPFVRDASRDKCKGHLGSKKLVDCVVKHNAKNEKFSALLNADHLARDYHKLHPDQQESLLELLRRELVTRAAQQLISSKELILSIGTDVLVAA